MIELLLAADRLLADGSLDGAERIYRQIAEADARNAMAVVGLARVAAARGQSGEAAAAIRRALEIDPEDTLARQLEAELERATAPEGAGRDDAEMTAHREDETQDLDPPSPSSAPTTGNWVARLLARLGFR